MVTDTKIKLRLASRPLLPVPQVGRPGGCWWPATMGLVRNVMRHDRAEHLAAIPYGSSLEEIQEGVSAEAVSYAAGLLVEAVRTYESAAVSARKQNLSLTEAQMIAANLIAKASARLDDKTIIEQIDRVRKSIREVKP